MDNFLQLVPIANDSDLDQGLVYGEDDVPGAAAADTGTTSALGDHTESHDASSLFAAATRASSRSSSVHISSNSSSAVLSELRALEALESADPDERERRAYLARARLLEVQMQQAERETQQRLDAMARILALADPLEQLSEYMALKLDERRCEPGVDITAELLECARRLTNQADSEIALLGAFFFSCTAAAPSPTTRGAAALLPIVAAMTDGASSAASLEQSVIL